MAKIKKLTASALKRAGYTWKVSVLNADEKEQAKNGAVRYDENGEPLKDKNGRIRRFEPPDFQYFFKVKDGHEIRIYKVGDRFYWNNGRVEKLDQLDIIEKHAAEMAGYEKLFGQMKDTKPPEPTLGTIVEERTSKWPDVIELQGGPFAGQKRPYNTKFPFFMEQLTTDGLTEAHRYRRDQDNKLLYKFDKTV